MISTINRSLKFFKTSLHAALVLICLFLAPSCNNDLEVFADYQEQAVIYGLLDAASEVQYVKIGRTFLNPGVPASQIAQVPDSLYFEDITVTLTALRSGTQIVFTPIDSIPKDTGFFQSDVNIIYAAQAQLDPSSLYRLEVLNNKTGFRAQSVTSVVASPVVLFPVTNLQPIFSVSPNLDIQIRFFSGQNAMSQEAFMEFSISEYNNRDSSLKQTYDLTWRMMRTLLNTTTSPTSRARSVPGENFYEFLLAVLPHDTSVYRKFDRIDFILYSASEELTDFIEASRPSIGIVQKQIDYTNIEGGIGLFASRHTYKVSNLRLAESSYGFFNIVERYKDLNFVE